MILTSDGKPIFGGTYFPPEDKKIGDDTAPGMVDSRPRHRTRQKNTTTL
ncbi:MAG: hypothetical protein U0792_12240 [Gemmataceae bacterium]